MDEIFFLMIAYLPIIAIIVGVLSIVTYVYLKIKKKAHTKICLIISCICVGVWLLIVGSLFLAGLLGLGPVPT